MRDGAAALQQALDEGFTEFVVLGMMPSDAPGFEDGYQLKVFSRPRPKPVLMHILSTADNYVMHCLGNEPN